MMICRPDEGGLRSSPLLITPSFLFSFLHLFSKTHSLRGCCNSYLFLDIAKQQQQFHFSSCVVHTDTAFLTPPRSLLCKCRLDEANPKCSRLSTSLYLLHCRLQITAPHRPQSRPVHTVEHCLTSCCVTHTHSILVVIHEQRSQASLLD